MRCQSCAEMSFVGAYLCIDCAGQSHLTVATATRSLAVLQLPACFDPSSTRIQDMGYCVENSLQRLYCRPNPKDINPKTRRPFKGGRK